MDAHYHKIVSAMNTIKDGETKKIVCDDVIYVLERMYNDYKLRMDYALCVWFDRYEIENNVLYLYQGNVIVGSLW